MGGFCLDKKIKKNIKKEIKKHLTGITLFFAVLFLVIGAVLGFVGYSLLNSGSDETLIELNGDEVINLEVGSKYKELGATFIIDGVDYENDVVIEGTVNTNKEGIYSVTYTLNNDCYQVVLKRIVNVGGVSNGE